MKIIVTCPKCDQKLRVTLRPSASLRETTFSTSVREPSPFKWPEKEWNELWGSFHKFMKSVFPPRKA